MKVLTIKEPYATLIKEKKKYIETRSWKTNYRGPLYIHAGIAKIPKDVLNNQELMALVGNKKMNYGYIICECNLVDCLYMTKEYVKAIKKNHNEYICGDFKEGRYAWILDDIKPLKTIIKAQGKLSFWNYYDEVEISKLLNNVEYGWLDKKGQKHFEDTELFATDYLLQTPKEVITNKIGVCWDQVELERYYFKQTNLPIKTYYIVYYNNAECPTHTFLTFKKNNKYYWFEHSWERFRGIHEYATLEAMLLSVQDKFIHFELNNHCEKENLAMYEYDNPPYHLNALQFMEYCENGKRII